MRKPAYIETQPRRCDGGETGERGACLACGSLAGKRCQAPKSAQPRPCPAPPPPSPACEPDELPEAATEKTADDRAPDGVAVSQLRSIIDRVERLEAEKAEIGGAIKEVYHEAKGNGFDVKTLRKIVRLRKQDRAKRLEEEALLDLYLVALGEA